jgi:Ser/Thr protein kinase RdoA (MazF antagonist)
LIEKRDGSIVFIDFEGIGMGSRYQDLGFIYWGAAFRDQPDLYTAFLQGYQEEAICIEEQHVKRLAGLISLAYVGFALAFAREEDAAKRLQLGLRLLEEAGYPAPT